ncbi:hypothetical protein [Phaffia rhodozyma]|uniref:Uncharacterized protein n=1 Tax=Phaffia rhodozyma TaxID=264483 RepID=A0A0F7SWV4_PHARH|nr:hypothetical protein [Phaffia rhodozyma]
MPPTRNHPSSLHIRHPIIFTKPPAPGPTLPPPGLIPIALKPPSRRIEEIARQLAKEQGSSLVSVGEISRTIMGIKGGSGGPATTKSSKGAASWNTLLGWARKRRGPQWDASTQMYMVDYLSPSYYQPPVASQPVPTNVPASLSSDPSAVMSQIDSPSGGPSGMTPMTNVMSARTPVGHPSLGSISASSLEQSVQNSPMVFHAALDDNSASSNRARRARLRA